MNDATIETQKRLQIADRLISVYEPFASSVILAGSVAYSPNNNVTEQSDLDLLVTSNDLRENLDSIIRNERERESLQARFFEGYCIQDVIEDVPVSVHFMSHDALDIIDKTFVGDIRVYRSNRKKGHYTIKNFEGKTYDYYIKNISLDDLEGFRTIVPVSFISKDSYYIGIHRDKLLSNPLFLYEDSTFSRECIAGVWKTVVQNLVDESRRTMGRINLEKMNVLNALAKTESMNADVRAEIEDKTSYYVKKLK